MSAVPTHPAYRQSVHRPWYRRGVTLCLAAIVMGIAGWVSGVFDSPLLTQLADRAIKKPATHSVSATANRTDALPAPIGNDSSISKVPLPLILTGTMPGRNPREGQALIGVNKNSPQTYAAGAILANNARIAEIYADHVVLERDNQRVNLYLQGTGKQSDAKQLTSLLTVGGTAAPPPAKVTNHEILTDYLRPSPVYDGQLLKGYQVYAGQQSSVFAQMGLQAGDVITAINGVPLNEPTSAIEQLKQLTQGYAVTATVERQGKTETLSLDGALITADQQRLQSPPSSSGMTMPPM